jgi:hypothetical protein
MLRDFDKDYRDDQIGNRDFITMVDVDYYVDINHYLGYGKPMMIYTFVPTTVGGPVPDGSFSIKDDIVTYNVDGGASYQHKLWDYNITEVAVDAHCGYWWLGWLPRDKIIHTIEQRLCVEDETRRIICFTPVMRIPWWLFGFWNFRKNVRRMSYSAGAHNILEKTVSGK